MSTRRPRTSYMTALKKDKGSSLLCSAWIHGPNCRKEEVSHAIVGKSVGNAGSSHGVLEISRYDLKEDLVAESVYSKEENELPQSIAVHPGGDGVLCSFSNSWKLYELEIGENLKLKESNGRLSALEEIGPQSRLLFSSDGSRLAAGAKDGHLRVFEWPTLNILFDQPDGCKFLSSLDISLDGAFLAAIPENGSLCRVWEIEKATVLTTITNSNKGEVFGSCRFSRDGTKPFLFITINKGGKGFIGVWELEGWTKIGRKMLMKDAITSLAVSYDGKWLALGGASGDACLVEVKPMNTVEHLKDAQSSPVVSLEFSPNTRVLLSVSSDSTARISKLNAIKPWKEWQLYAVLVGLILLSIVIFYIFFELSDSFWNFPLGRNQPARPFDSVLFESQHDIGEDEL